MLIEEAIQVVWVDEATEQRKARPTYPPSSWDRCETAFLRRRVRREARSRTASGVETMQFIIEPKNPERRELIEKLFAEEGITVLWSET
jgi:hypothetical protein